MSDVGKAPETSKALPPSRDDLDDPVAYSVADWRLHNDGEDNKSPNEEIEKADEYVPSIMTAVGKVFEEHDSRARMIAEKNSATS